MDRPNGRSTFLLLLTAFIWGSAFVAQSVGMDYVGPFTFNSVRNLVGGLVLLPFIWLRGQKQRNSVSGDGAMEDPVRLQTGPGTLICGGICCGVALCAAAGLQQIGIQYTTVGKAGFITAMYIVLVPVFGIFLKRTAGLKIWVSVALAAAGLYLLCMKEGLSLQKGDFLVLLCAVVFSFHILIIDYFSPKTDGVKMSCIQFFVCGLLSGLFALGEHPQLSTVLSAWLPVLYAGVFSSGVAYTLQIIAQKDMNPTVASLIMSLESVFSVLAGWVVLGQRLSMRELGGCVLMFAAIILTQLPSRRGSGDNKFRQPAEE